MDSEAHRATIERACREVLRPIVRLLLKAGWTWRDFAEVGRRTFVTVASTEFGKRGRLANASRVAILTGLNRRDVSRLRVDAADDAEPPGFVSPGSRLLSGWHQDPDFLDDSRRPRPLSAAGRAPDEPPGFPELVRRHAPDLPVVAMLKELRAAGAVRVDDAGRVHALQRSYVPRAADPNQLRLWGTVLHDVGTTLEHNVMRPDDAAPRFERAAVVAAVDVRHLPAFRAFLEREGQAFLERVDDWLTAHAANHGAAGVPDSPKTAVRLGAGVYHVEDVPAPPARAPQTPRAPRGTQT